MFIDYLKYISHTFLDIQINSPCCYAINDPDLAPE